MPIVRAGSSSERNAAAGSCQPARGKPCAGSQPSQTANTTTSIMPAQTTGTAASACAPTLSAVPRAATPAHRRDDAERQAEQQRDRERHDPERDRHLRLLGELRRHARPGQQRRAQIAAEDSADPLQILSRERLVQSQPLPDRLDLLRRAVGAGDQLRDVTGKHPQGEEDQHAGDEEPEQEQGRSRQRVADHPLLLASSARLRRSFTLIEGIPVMLVPTATTEAPL